MWRAMRQFCRYQQVPIGRTSMQRNVSSSFAFLLSMRRALTMLRATRERWCDDVRIQSVRKATWYACRYRRMRLNAPSTNELFLSLFFFVMCENLSTSLLCIVHSYGDENTVVVCDSEIESMQKTTRKLDRVGMCLCYGEDEHRQVFREFSVSHCASLNFLIIRMISSESIENLPPRSSLPFCNP